MILKMWVESKFVLWQPRYYNLIKKGQENSYFWSTHLFWKPTVTVNRKKFSSSTIFRWYALGKFYIAKFNYFRGRPNTVKKKLEWFLIDHYTGDIENKNIAGKYYKIFVSVSPTLL